MPSDNCCRRAELALLQAVAAEHDFNTAAFQKELVKFAETEEYIIKGGRDKFKNLPKALQGIKQVWQQQQQQPVEQAATCSATQQEQMQQEQQPQCVLLAQCLSKQDASKRMWMQMGICMATASFMAQLLTGGSGGQLKQHWTCNVPFHTASAM